MDKPAEILLFDFMTERIAAAVSGDVIYQLELHDTIYQKITQTRGLRISDAVGDLSPAADGSIKEYDVFVTLACYSRVEGKQKTDRQPALTDVFGIQKEIYRILIENPTLGGRVCDLLIQKGGRGYDAYDEGPFAVANIPLVINPSGARYTE